MTTPELISYIRSQLQKGIDKETIVSRLVGAGWRTEDVNEGFNSVDLYQEPITGDNLFDTSSQWNPQKENNIVEGKDNQTGVINKIQEVPKEVNIPEIVEEKKESPQISTSISTPQISKSLDIKKPETPVSEKISSNVWIPKTVPIKQKPIIEETGTDNQIKPTAININKVSTPLIKEDIKSVSYASIKNISPTLANNFDSLSKNVPLVTKVENTISLPKDNVIIENKSSGKIPDDVSKLAMLSSYKNDLIYITKKKDEEKKDIPKKEHKKRKKWPLIILLIILLLLGGGAFAYFNGYIDIEDINILNIKKDPKTLLLNNSKTLASLSSYKTETNIEIMFPTFANIISGLITGEAVSSNDKDSILINSLGLINQTDQGALSDDFITFKGSLVPSYITTDIKKDTDSNLYITIPDLSSLTEEFTPEVVTIEANKEEFNSVISLFPKNISERLTKINLYRILDTGILSYINNETLSSYNDLINNVEITEKDVESIKGIDTYHYSIVADRQLYKNLINKISSNLIDGLSDEDQDNLNQILNSATINSFDVWIGKSDNNIYQYNVDIDIPLSKIVDFSDESIGDNVVSISWKTTYYDFDVQNNIFMPTDYTSISSFIKNFEKGELENKISSFSKIANDLYNIEKSYGTQSNTNGSCMKPTSGSLFSPIGHSSKTTEQIGAISSFLNEIFEKTNDNGFCYSTTKSWSFTIPIADDYSEENIPEGGYQSFFCIDSEGNKAELTAYPEDDICISETSEDDTQDSNQNNIQNDTQTVTTDAQNIQSQQ